MTFNVSLIALKVTRLVSKVILVTFKVTIVISAPSKDTLVNSKIIPLTSKSLQ